MPRTDRRGLAARWAEHKERDLSSAAGVTAKVLTRFPVSGGVTAEPELLLTLDVQTEPRASQVLCSIHADGRMVVWFGAWKLPPFDDQEERARLRKLLNDLDGVHVHSRQASGWPRIPISALEDRATLVCFTGELDRLAEESHAVPSSAAGTGGHRVDGPSAGTTGAVATATALGEG